MTATYFRRGAGRSLNAREAERAGRMPLTRAKRDVAQQYGCTQAVAAAALALLHEGEWHHVGKYAAECRYYDTADDRLPGVIHQVLAAGGAAQFAARVAALRAARRANAGEQYVGVGRYAAWAARRAKARTAAAEALGRPVQGQHAVDGWDRLVRMTPGGLITPAAAGRAAGWTDDALALALADAGYPADSIRRHL